jgi:WD40 repeat protein
VFDGRRIEPGTRGTHLEDGEFLTAHTNDLGVDVMTAYQIEGMQRKGVWRLPARSVREEALFNRPLTHCVNRITNFRENGRTGTNDVEVYASGGDGPLFSGKGDPLALSPDGRFFMVQTAGKRAVLQDLQEKRTVHTFDAKADWDTQIYVAFSDDGRRVAVNAYPNLEVVDLTEGFPRRTMAPEDRQRGINCSQDKWHYGAGQSICFSPDGTLLLSGGYGRAWLHDAATGALLHTFIETAHFYEAQPYTQGSFMKSLEQSARDWAGVVTDAYKGSGPVHVAFGAFGDHAITHAGGKIIRVWDSRSGALINTIETGLPEKRNANWFINNRIVFSGNGEYALAYNRDNFAPASLLSLADGTLIRRYKFPDNSSFNIALSEDGKSVYLLDKGDLNRWPGRPKDSAANP